MTFSIMPFGIRRKMLTTGHADAPVTSLGTSRLVMNMPFRPRAFFRLWPAYQPALIISGTLIAVARHMFFASDRR